MPLPRSRILVVDDVPANRDVLIRRLSRMDLSDVVEAENGVEALERIRTVPFDLVLLDVMMPDMSGIEVLRAMRDEQRLEDVPVVMISAASEMEKVVECIRLGAEDYLPKPFNPALLEARIRAALERKHLRGENRRQLARLQADLEEARTQQIQMVPSEFPVDPARWEVAARMEPALEVGGDLYDVFEAAPGQLCLAIGDVAGKGTAAGLFMARTRSLLRGGTLQHAALAGALPKPSEVAALVNDELCKNNPDARFVTLLVGFLDLAGGCFTYCNAGHVYPVRVGPGVARELEARSDPALGVVEDFAFTDQVVTIAPGDLLLLTSDGLADMQNAAEEAFSTSRALAVAEETGGASAAALVEALVDAAYGFAAGTPQFDDVTLLAIRRLA